MKVPLLDLKKQYQTIKGEILESLHELIESQYFILGPHVESLEQNIAAYCRARFATGVSSGTDALLVSLMAAGIQQGDVVITTPYTFFATVGSIARTGARVLFADIDPDTYNISPKSIEKKLAGLDDSEKASLKAIIPVHLYGQCAEMYEILQISKKYNLLIIEDAAQAIGAEYQGTRAGSICDMGCFSFFPSKNLGAFGDGGMVTTNSEELHYKLCTLRGHGSDPKYYHKLIGGNFRLDAIQAAVISIKLKYLDKWTAARQENANRYRELFAEADLDGMIKLPLEKEKRHIYNQFVISLKKNRDELRQYLQEAGIGTEIYYPVPMHLQECFAYMNYKKGDFPESEYAAEHTLALPVYPELSDDQLEYVVTTIKEFYT
ncbi:MAG: DegT/DnrJ/EryC1/StrS family aminotransferase [Deltaproteobacteria bacterium]|nr:DegT/DnrJ/EryC1/StrS family aminotransferase [Deltaproteobacteria bacterium]